MRRPLPAGAPGKVGGTQRHMPRALTDTLCTCEKPGASSRGLQESGCLPSMPPWLPAGPGQPWVCCTPRSPLLRSAHEDCRNPAACPPCRPGRRLALVSPGSAAHPPFSPLRSALRVFQMACLTLLFVFSVDPCLQHHFPMHCIL